MKAMFKINGNESTVLETTGGTDVMTTEDLLDKYEHIYFTVAVYSDSACTTQTDATTGTVTFNAYDNDVKITIPSGTFDAADVRLTTRTQPTAKGEFTSATITLVGVDAGLFVKAWVNLKGASA